MTTIAIYTRKGGVGKTVTAANLAALFARDRRVLAIDTDAQYSLTSVLKPDAVQPDNFTYDVLFDLSTLDEAVIEVPRPSAPHLSLLTSDDRMDAADRILPDESGAELRLRRALRRSEKEYDLVIIDVPSKWGIVARNAMLAATHLLIPVDVDSFAYDCAGDTIGHLHKTCAHNDAPLPEVGVLLTAYTNTNNSKEIEALCAETWPEALLSTRIRQTVKVKELTTARSTVVDFAPSLLGTAYEDYAQLAKEIEQTWLS